MVCNGSPRSISLPLESNSVMVRIGRELKKLKAREESSTSAAETISVGLSGIADLYKCISEMLSLPLTQQHEKCVAELIEVSSKLLEICSAARETALQMKESSGDLRSALGETNECQESRVLSYICSRKKIMKSTKQILSSLKRIGGDSFVSLGVSDDADERVSAVIQALRCVSIISISIHENLLLFLGSKLKYGGKRSLFSKLIRKGKGACEDVTSRNEVENVDDAICGLSSLDSDENIRLAHKSLEALESGIQGIERGLESLSRQLTQTRILLLKVLSP